MYYVYIVQCADGTLYTGLTTDTKRRIREHNSLTTAAKYTRARRPVQLVFTKKFRSRATAAREEFRIKKLSRIQKLALIELAK